MEHDFTISFFGHRAINDWDTVQKRLERILEQIIRCHCGVTFLVGSDGDFDHLVSSVVRRLKRKSDRCDLFLVLVMPYPRADFIHDIEALRAYYDEVEICEKSAVAHPKSAFQLRNKDMIDNSDLVVCYVERRSGGAHQARSYAKKQNKEIINLAEETTMF